MTEKTIGVLGGMGPEATLAFYGKIIANTPAAADQDHLRVLIDSNPKVPDRTAAILHGGPSPLPALERSAAALARAGADFVVIPCVSAHFFLEELRARIALPVISMLDVTAAAIGGHRPRISTVGLLATSGTITGARFQERLAAEGVKTVTPAPDDQRRVMDAIYAIKGAPGGRDRAALAAELAAVAGRLAQRGAEGIVAGCTEIPLVLTAGDLPLPLFDTLLLLARAAIAAAGRKPVDARQR